jgi:hypothetical protein
MKITPVGYFRELRHGMSNGPSLKEAVSKGQYSFEKAKLVFYLKSGLVYIASPGLGIDVWGAEGQVSGPIHALTDGRWMWPADLAYYVETYNIALPQAFIDDLRKHHWKNPNANEIDITKIEIDIPC